MNYKVLYRKYRPDSFDSLVGQEHVVAILKNSIKDNKIAHAYLFSGPRGTGKTSTARILAKTINCLNNKDGLACEKCASCESFNGNPDIIEIDAASNNGVDEIRELINNVKIMPTSLKYKVYIIDEVHMLSQSAFNALLLTLEEPPEHVIFILATTNIESVPITILSRCQRFDFKRINENDILNRLKYICDLEKISYDEEGLKEIANLSDGGMRDALSILDQLSKNNEIINVDLVSREIGTISNKKIMSLIKCLDTGDLNELEKIFIEIENTNLNYKVVIKKIIYYLSEVGSNILKGTEKWQISFDEIKHLVMDLNDLLNKININVEPYLLIKMTFLSYIKKSKEITPKKEISKNETKVIENKEQIKEMEKEKLLYEQVIKPKNEDKNISDKLIDIRINNCFVKASKSYLNDFKIKWNTFINEVENAQIKGLASDTTVVTASDAYAIIVSLIPHKELEVNESLEKVEEAFKNVIKTNYKLIFISDDKWQKEKEKYIKNLQSKYVYTYISEAKEMPEEVNSEDISAVADIFDIEKIEVE